MGGGAGGGEEEGGGRREQWGEQTQRICWTRDYLLISCS